MPGDLVLFDMYKTIRYKLYVYFASNVYCSPKITVFLAVRHENSYEFAVYTESLNLLVEDIFKK